MMKKLQFNISRKTTGIAAFAICALVFASAAYAQTNVPDTARLVLGSGYDLTGSFANSTEIKQPVLNMDRLIADRKVIRDANQINADFQTVTGKNISEYTENFASKNGLTIDAGANILSLSASFKHETSKRFGSDRVGREEYEFATSSSIIKNNAFFIRNQNLSPYVSQSFISDVNTMTAQQIITKYGTHVMLGLLIGARLDYNMSVRKKSQTESSTINNLATTSFDAKFRGIGVGLNNNSELEKKFGQMYDINSLKTDTSVIGGRPQLARSIHDSQSYDAWINSIDDGNIVWIGYYPNSLIPLDQFIVEELFGARAQALKIVLRDAIEKHLGIGVTVQTPLPPNFVRVEGGTFQMGSSSGGYDDERPVHTVTVKSFSIGKYEVTQREWSEVMRTTVRQQLAMEWGFMRGEGDNYPMYNVNWYEAVEYCNRRSLKEGLTPAYRGSGDSITCDWNANGYRLPTEAEWEFAAKGGTKDYLTTEYSGSNSVDAVAWYRGNSENGIRPVGTKAANSLGLHDMSGNVSEWCWDWKGSYSSGSQTDPRGAAAGDRRVARGGSCIDDASYARSAYRSSITPSDRRDDVGFRLVRP
jgi:formylglycine-generating enzyme required for sulfatase activity